MVPPWQTVLETWIGPWEAGARSTRGRPVAWKMCAEWMLTVAGSQSMSASLSVAYQTTATRPAPPAAIQGQKTRFPCALATVLGRDQVLPKLREYASLIAFGSGLPLAPFPVGVSPQPIPSWRRGSVSHTM